MLSKYQIEKIRKRLALKEASNADLSDVDIISKWHHNTNIEASDQLLVLLKRYHKEMDY